MRNILSCRATSELTGLSERTLERLRASGEGPPFIRLSERRIGYREDDVLEWIERRRHASRAAEARSAA
jgi:predicted DNA-binding transcriptional regulator AlpA